MRRLGEIAAEREIETEKATNGIEEELSCRWLRARKQ
jgi:hypothetical protein